MLEEKKDFVFVDFKNSDITGIELLMPEFSEVVYHYHKVRIVEDGDQARLQFGYTIIHPGHHNMEDLDSNRNFHKIMGDILSYILIAKSEYEQNKNLIS
jgi:hypothetical protein